MRLRAFAAAAVLAGTVVVGSAGLASAQDGPDGATAVGNAQNSPGLLSGNNIQVPVHVPVNVCGNSIDVIGLLNPAFGNQCAND
ncbi:chaplin [Streptomyces kunmingensis]|uniref:Chaplin n=1 Tax=Streptomyces kunmingensis TaxID=68225 RepID=A0ABU6C4I6_9ACTN|nr:chaplin [Streptomyces kunmingensis]MEB3959643.1 chaplin [Streptomyces kunmingensis]